jgi:transposase
MSEKTFGEFMSGLSQGPNAEATKEILDAIAEKLKAEKAAEMEVQLRNVWTLMQRETKRLRLIRQLEDLQKSRIKQLEEMGTRIVKGEEDVEVNLRISELMNLAQKVYNV